MYPFNYRPQRGFVDLRKVFVAMPFANEYEAVYTDLIIPAIKEVNNDLEDNEKLTWYRGKDPTHTRSGWLDILENLFTSRIVLGVLSGDNPNVFYELGIAHATQQLERQLLIAEERYSSKFDLKDLIYTRYDPDNLVASIPSLASALRDTLKVYDINIDRMVSLAESRLSVYEFKIMVRYGVESHFFLPEGEDPLHYEGLAHLCHSGLLRLSAKPSDGKIEYSYYWTDLGNAVLHRLNIIQEHSLKHRINKYHEIFNE